MGMFYNNLNHMSKLHKMVVKFVATRWYCIFKASYNLSLFGQFVLQGMNLNYQMLYLIGHAVF